MTIALAHYQFEAVHPFLDGNGRVGRLLITLFLIERQILPTPLLYLSAFFEASRRDYYDGLRGISEHGAWNDWLEYFLLGVARMSEDALSRAMRINGLLAEWQKKVSGESSNNPLRVVELLGANPFITTKGVADKLAIAFTTANADVPGLTTVTNSATDASDASAALGYSKFNQGVTAAAYYSIGISSTNGVSDTSTGGGTAVNGLAYSSNGAGTGVATVSYTDGAGQNLSATDLSSQGDAQSALTSLNTAIADVAAQDGYIGAQINTLNAVSQVLSTQQENVQSAQNAVQATDYAMATSNMSKYEILSQTGIAALAQANSQQQEVLKLLQ